MAPLSNADMKIAGLIPRQVLEARAQSFGLVIDPSEPNHLLALRVCVASGGDSWCLNAPLPEPHWPWYVRLRKFLNGMLR
jgi:hypothetical protein